MLIYRLKLGFANITDKDLVTISDNVKLSMETKAKTFEAILPAIELFLAAYLKFSNSKLPRPQRSQLSASIKNQCKEDAIFELTMLGYAVMSVARNHLPTLISSGFEMAKEGENASEPDMPNTPNLKVGKKPTSLVVAHDKVSGADSYNIEVTIANSDKNWSQNSKTLSATFEALPLGVELRVRVAAVNAAGQGEWSNTAVITLPTINL